MPLWLALFVLGATGLPSPNLNGAAHMFLLVRNFHTLSFGEFGSPFMCIKLGVPWKWK